MGDEPRCIGHYIGAGYSNHGLAKNCPHAECKALAGDRLAQHFRNCPDRGVGYDGIHGLGCGCQCICGPEACDDGGDPDVEVFCAYCAALDPSLPCPNERTYPSPADSKGAGS